MTEVFLLVSSWGNGISGATAIGGTGCSGTAFHHPYKLEFIGNGSINCVPSGNGNKTTTGFWEDSTRLPEYHNGTYHYLKSLGPEKI